jgi:hypothetical protein
MKGVRIFPNLHAYTPTSLRFAHSWFDGTDSSALGYDERMLVLCFYISKAMEFDCTLFARSLDRRVYTLSILVLISSNDVQWINAMGQRNDKYGV